jgi:ribosomal protein S9
LEALGIKIGPKGFFRIRADVHGGGLSAQADAIRLGVANALVDYYKQSLNLYGVFLYVQMFLCTVEPVGELPEVADFDVPTTGTRTPSTVAPLIAPRVGETEKRRFITFLSLLTDVRNLALEVAGVKSFLRKGGYLTVDCRRKERKKYGLKKARKASQYSKR